VTPPGRPELAGDTAYPLRFYDVPEAEHAAIISTAIPRSGAQGTGSGQTA
jgi:hypothetical protein